MTRVIIKIKADCIDLRDGWIMVWNGEALVAIAKAEDVSACYISEKKE